MPPLSRWYIKLAMLYLVAGLIISIIQALPAGLRPSLFAFTGPAYIHMLVVGWITQMIFGVAYWMFPKDTAEAPRGHDSVANVTLVLLNVGLLPRVIVEPLRA